MVQAAKHLMRWVSTKTMTKVNLEETMNPVPESRRQTVEKILTIELKSF